MFIYVNQIEIIFHILLMLNVWNGFKLKACGYIKSLEPKSPVYATVKQMCWRGNLFGWNLYSFKCSRHATSYLPNRTSVVVLLEAFARNFDPTGSAWKKGQFSPREVQCWTYLMLYLPIFTCHETLRKTVLTVSYSQLFSLHQSIVELVLSWQLMACSFYKWDSGFNLYWSNL